AGIIDQHVDPTAAFDQTFHGCGAGLVVTYVHLLRCDPVADATARCQDLLGCSSIAAAQKGDIPALLRDQPHQRAADAAAAACDQNALSGDSRIQGHSALLASPRCGI